MQCDVKLSECERVRVRESESESERSGARVNRLKWGAFGLRESVINYFMLDIDINSLLFLFCKQKRHSTTVDDIISF